MQQSLSEGLSFGIDIPEVNDLRFFVDKALRWQDMVQRILSKRHNTRKLGGVAIEPPRRLADLRALLREAEQLHCDTPELPPLEMLVEKASAMQLKAQHMLATMTDGSNVQGGMVPIPLSTTQLQDLNNVFEHSRCLDVHFDELDIIRRRIEEVSLGDVLGKARGQRMSYPALLDLLRQADAAALPSDHEHVKYLYGQKALADSWLELAGRALSSAQARLEDYERLLEMNKSMIVEFEQMAVVQKIVGRCREWLWRFEAFDSGKEVWPIAWIKSLLAEGATLPIGFLPQIEKLGRWDRWAEMWANNVKALFLRRTNRSLEDIIKDVLRNVSMIGRDYQELIARGHYFYCFCLRSEAGFMIQCDNCQEWYHGRCVDISRKDVTAQMSYHCPVCDPTKTVFHWSKQPSVASLIEGLRDADAMVIRLEEAELIRQVISNVNVWRARVAALLTTHGDDLKTLRALLRQADSIELTTDELYQLRARLAAISPPLSKPAIAQQPQPIHHRCICGEFADRVRDVMCHRCRRWVHEACSRELGREGDRELLCFECSGGPYPPTPSRVPPRSLMPGARLNFNYNE